jgi:acyl carrier protein
MKTFDEQFNDVLIEKYLVAENDIQDSSMFLAELQFDIEEIIRFIRDVESKFQVKIKRSELKHFLTVGEAKKCIKQKLKIYDFKNLN